MWRRIFLRKPVDPFSTITVGDTGSGSGYGRRSGPATGPSRSTLTCGRRRPAPLIADWFRFFAGMVSGSSGWMPSGYVVKRAGTSCFMVEPEIWETIDWLVATRRRFGPRRAAGGP